MENIMMIILIAVVCLILINIVFLINLGGKIKNQQQKQEEREQKKSENLADINKAEKASYLLLKKCFQDLDERMNRLENIVLPITNSVEFNEKKIERCITEVKEEQKKIGKIIIGRNKETGEAIMSNGEELGEKISLLAEKLYGIEEKILSLDVTVPVQMNETTANISEEIQPSLQESIPEPKIIDEGKPITEAKIEEEPIIGVEIEEEPIIEPEAIIGAEIEEEPIIELEPITGAEIKEEPIIEPEAIIGAEIEEEPIIEPEAIIGAKIEEESIIEPEIIVPDSSDPNKIMSTDDIAALLASLNGDAAGAESNEESEFDFASDMIFDEELKEDKPAVSNMSDTNKVMTPEEIAALIANL